MERVYLIVAGVAVGVTALAFAALWIRRATRPNIFPTEAPPEVWHRESRAIVRSLKSGATRWGGMKHCMRVTVTPEEIWITAGFPYSLLLEPFDLEHRIAKSQIVGAARGKAYFGQAVRLEIDAGGESRVIEIVSKRPEGFEPALEQLGVTIQPVADADKSRLS